MFGITSGNILLIYFVEKKSELNNLGESAPIAQVTTHNTILGYCTQLLVINPTELQTGCS
jgi:hypothetical protein